MCLLVVSIMVIAYFRGGLKLPLRGVSSSSRFRGTCAVENVAEMDQDWVKQSRSSLFNCPTFPEARMQVHRALLEDVRWWDAKACTVLD